MYNKIVDLTLDECPMIYHCNTNNIQVYNKKLVGLRAVAAGIHREARHRFLV